MTTSGITNINAKLIHQHPDNPRKDLGDLTELSESIKKKGIMQNLTVIPGHWDEDKTHHDEGYTLIIGHRRFAAGKMAGVTMYPCRIVEDMSYKDQVGTMLEENMQRIDLTPLEQAEGFQMMLDLGDTEEQIAEKTGFSRTTVRRRLEIAKLDRDLVKNKKIIVELLEAAGIKKAPKEIEKKKYTAELKDVKTFSLDKEPPKKINIRGKELYYLDGWDEIDVVEKPPKSKKVETEWDRQRKKIKQLKALQKKMNERKKEFIRTIADGKIELLKDEECQKIIEKMIRNMMEKSCWLGNGMVLKFFTGKSLYDAGEKEKEEAEEKIQTLDTQVLLLIAMNNMMDDYTGDLVEYSGEYKEDAGKRYQECFKILMRYGWSYEREEADLVYGNHELYKKES